MKLTFLLKIYIIVFLESGISVTGFVDITLNPPQVLQDVTSTLSLSFSCNVGAANEIREITTLQLSRNGVVLARIFVYDNLSAVYDKSFEQEANSRGFVLDGKVTKIAPSPPTAFITLALNRSKVVCSDQLQYTCHLEYYDMSIKLQLDEQSANLSVYVPPSMVQNALKVYKDGLIIGGGDSKDTAATCFKVGDTVTLECGTSIGSDSTTKIYWKITSELIESTFIDYQPPAGNSTDEVAIAGKCEFTRKAKAQYNITSVDANRNYKTLLGFLCYAVAFHGGQRYETLTSEKFYINVGSSSGTPPTFTNLNTNRTTIIPENAPVHSIVYTLIAFDLEANKLTYGKVRQTPNHPDFQLNTTSGELYSPSGIDAEKTQSFVFIFDVSDGSITVQSATLTISIRDINDNIPLFTIGSYSITILKNVANGTPVQQVTAIDDDVTSVLQYSIVDGNTPPTFNIDNSGVITVANANNMIVNTKFSLQIQASDGTFSSNTMAFISVVDTNSPQQEKTSGLVVGPIVGGTIGAIGFIASIILVYMLVIRKYECTCRKITENSHSHAELQTSLSTIGQLYPNITMEPLQIYQELKHKSDDAKTNESVQTYEKLNRDNTVDRQPYQGLKYDR